MGVSQITSERPKFRDQRHTVLEIIREHNRLNGYRFVVGEFLLVALAALLIAASGFLHHRAVIGFTGIGIPGNAAAVIAIAISQIRASEAQEGILRWMTAEFRAKVRRSHPDLNTHTLIIVVSVLVPFLLVCLVCSRRNKKD